MKVPGNPSTWDSGNEPNHADELDAGFDDGLALENNAKENVIEKNENSDGLAFENVDNDDGNAASGDDDNIDHASIYWWG